MKPVLFSDLDGVLFETDGAFNAFLQEHYGVTIPPNSHHCGYSMETLVLEQIPEDSRPTLGDFYEHVGIEFLASMKWHEDVVPVPESVETVLALSQMYDIFVVTARQTVSHPVVMELVRRYFPGKFKGFHFAYTCTGNGQFEKIPKRDFIGGFHRHRRMGFIDDSPLEIRDVSDIAPSFLFDPCGHYPSEKGHVRITSWSEFLDHLV